MTIYIKMKKTGRKASILHATPYEVSDNITSLRELLTELVTIEVGRYHAREADTPLISLLSEDELQQHAKQGKVGFGRIYTDKKAVLEEAIANALQCFQDGLVRVIHNEEELTELNQTIDIRENDTFTFIRLTFLAGRMW